MLITAAAQPTARNDFARTNTGILGSNPTRGMNICVFYVCVVLCKSQPRDRADHPPKENLF
jgi:hypothetical protein